MSQALHTSSTGINAGQAQVNVIANNVANINTTAFKSANMVFETLFSDNLSYGSAATKSGGGTNPKQIGLGVKVEGITRNFTPGTFVSTGRSMDLMISGNGFFVVQDSAGKQYFTRDGVLTTDSAGNVVTQSGMKLVGTTSSYSTTGSSSTVKVPTILKATVQPSDAGKVGAKKIYELNGADIRAGSFDVTVKDDDGATIGTVTMTIKQTDETVSDMVADFNAAITQYNSTAPDDKKINLTVSVTDGGIKFNNGTNQLSFKAISTNFLSEAGLNDSNYESHTLNKSVTLGDVVEYTDTDSIALSGTTVDDKGVIAATYSNGAILTTAINDNGMPVWKYTTPEGIQIMDTDVAVQDSIQKDSNFILELANMVNPEGLVSLNNNLWEWGPDVGEIYYGMAGEMAFGTIESGGYEGSNVDIASELSNLITAQRMIQMNSRVFSTASSIMETLAYLGS